jgi:hypothetical protein
MSRIVRGCCAIAFLGAAACAPRTGAAPSHPSAEARNGVSDKKPRKQRPVVAPPPAYGNKIVDRTPARCDQELAAASGASWM